MGKSLDRLLELPGARSSRKPVTWSSQWYRKA
jgi:hypothetical protein